MYAVSPLRYPGAKWRLEKFMVATLEENNISAAHYSEPYAGGASLALSLLFQKKVSHIHLNDFDRSVYAFWEAAIKYNRELKELIISTPVTIDAWHNQKEIQAKKETASIVELGFSTFFLNRTNRSGILKGGVIGGKSQNGKWKIDARFNKDDLLKRLDKLATHSSQISVTNMDASEFLRHQNKVIQNDGLLYLDPPYYVKGQGLYLNSYSPEDHELIANIVTKELTTPWIVSYDDVPEIRKLYDGENVKSYELRYSASKTRKGKEVIFAKKDININMDYLSHA